ncbi:MAG: hypothetical protein NTY48_03480 [Candidatus Diapherotrites archaeon]|nr:hypothetical protein [Candidatus Diapherotrites archaeon]
MGPNNRTGIRARSRTKKYKLVYRKIAKARERELAKRIREEIAKENVKGLPF